MKPDGNTVITIQMTVDTANVILGALGTQPYDRVSSVVNLIRDQATAQISAMVQPELIPAEGNNE